MAKESGEALLKTAKGSVKEDIEIEIKEEVVVKLPIYVEEDNEKMDRTRRDQKPITKDSKAPLKGFKIPRRPSSKPVPMPPHTLSKKKLKSKSESSLRSMAYDRHLPQLVLLQCRENNCDLCNAILSTKKIARNHYSTKYHKKKVKNFLKESGDTGPTGPSPTKNLPAEMLLRVFRCLRLQELKNVVLVSKRWRIIGEDPSLWKCYRFRVFKMGMGARDQIKNMFIGRFQRMQAIRIDQVKKHVGITYCEALFQDLSKIHQLKEIDFNCLQLAFVKPEFFATSLIRLETVRLPNITSHQANALFIEMHQNSQLKELAFSCNNLRPVEAGVFARAMTMLEIVDLRITHLTSIQRQELFKAMASQDSQLKKLNLCVNASEFSTEENSLLAEAVARLEDIDLGKTELSVQQMTWILAHVLEGSKLKKLVMRGKNTAGIAPAVVNDARKWLGHSLKLHMD